MGVYLIADFDWWLQPSSWLIILQVACGLGAVIFVHELGHFAVAKMCGVKCEKFYIGFDIGGWKIWKYQYGETEYGIGILPLGGYVKMLGQEDNPARVAEEMERAKIKGAEGEGFQLDPRSYMAQSVPKRMAIISAGVIMNVIFAFIFATIAYGMGVEYTPAVVANLSPGDAAWRAGIQVGDRLTQINNRIKPSFEQVANETAIGDIDDGLKLKIERPGQDKPIEMTLIPDRKAERKFPTIGIAPAVATILDAEQPVVSFSPAFVAKPALQGNDRIVAINDRPIETYAQLSAALALYTDEPIRVTVERSTVTAETSPSSKAKSTQRVEAEVAANPMMTLGMEMRMGPIVAVQAGSPAAEAGIKAGDIITAIDSQPVGDPIALPDRLRRRAGEQVTVELEGRSEAVSLTLRQPQSFKSPRDEGEPMSAMAMGVAYAITNEVVAVEPDGPAEKAGIKAGDIVVSAKLTQPVEVVKRDRTFARDEIEVLLGEKTANWATFHAYVLQGVVPGTRVELTLKDGRTISLEPVETSEWFVPQRGLALQRLFETRKAQSFSEAIVFGKQETVDSLMMVVNFLRKIKSGQVSATAVGGPFQIFGAASDFAERGPSQLLIFLCMLRPNLAVVNFLPIPVLDGGHMAFLTYELIRGKPASERVFTTASLIGFFLIVSLMLFALSQDYIRYML